MKRNFDLHCCTMLQSQCKRVSWEFGSEFVYDKMRGGERLNPFQTTSKGIMDRKNKKSFFESLQDLFTNDSAPMPIQGHELLCNLAISHIICV